MDIKRFDAMLMEILEERKTIAGFLDAIFGFLKRNTDFYFEKKDKDDEIGFPAGMKENIVLQVMQKFDPKYRFAAENSDVPPAIEEVEVATECKSTPIEDMEVQETENTEGTEDTEDSCEEKGPETEDSCEERAQETEDNCEEYEQEFEDYFVKQDQETDDSCDEMDQMPPSFAPSEYHNGNVLETYCWTQTLTDVEVFIPVPGGKNKNVQHVDGTANSISIQIRKRPNLSGETYAKYRNKEILWTVCDGKLHIIIEKIKPGWWDRFFKSEPRIDVSKIDCSTDINSLPQDSQMAIEKVRWEEKIKQTQETTGLEKQNLKLLLEAWDKDGSPFKGQPFDPSLVKFN